MIEDVDAGNVTAGTKSNSGGVNLYQNKAIVLIPTPSPDPKDPLNLPAWHKYLMIFLVGVYSAFAVLGTSGLGAVYPEVMKMYKPEEAIRATDLMTYPTLFMGLGNLFSMPLSVAIGRRPVFLASLVLLLASSIWCACSGNNLSSHIGGRNIFSMAAGQSEALAPLIVEEIHFLHERSAKLSWFVGVQTVGTAVMFIATTALVPVWGLKWWYGIIAIVTGVLLILSVLFMVETKYDRPVDADGGLVQLKFDEQGNLDSEGKQNFLYQVTTKQTHVLQPEIFGPRTWRYDLRVFHFKPDWKATVVFYKETLQCLIIPNVFWLLCLNGAFLGLYVYQASTFAQLLMPPPHLFTSMELGYVQLVQIADCMILIPVLGYGADFLVKSMSRWRDGIFKPEYRLLPIAFPAICAIISAVLYGRGAQDLLSWHWMTIVGPYHLGYFAFIGCNVISIAYCIDSFPRKAGPLLLVVCAGRGFISFGLSYSTVPAIKSLGYDGAMNILAIISGVLLAVLVPAYLTGQYFRNLFAKKVFKEESSVH
ncbi:major facilitator superfamily transporter [Aaosphaeria arxii CBS 175.79]|uniref:Major facilitator superfamily transporter n=1 Tax=Aaosphaeria arxii CBS 175.79 TaxID=1450172 RepID=A0A6A5X947_9PLEO|nr:major facilitator superfamily transporter [Aaosphaeria arxii CBS 175.79]KAF2009453.1 major facilitator superfamily transporter [Aaosphaeria arxii CBS 175.79]